MRQPAYIFFATGRSKKPRWRYRLISRLIRILTLSPVCHCMIAFEGVVLDPGLAGVRYWPLDVVIRRYPALYAVFRVPFAHRIDLDRFNQYHGEPQPVWPRLLRWIRFGRGPWIYDCLCLMLACLHAGGVEVNPHICTPAGLYRWLKMKGYPHASSAEHAGRFRLAAEHLCAD